MLRRIFHFHHYRRLGKLEFRRFFHNSPTILPVISNKINLTSNLGIARNERRKLRISSKLCKKIYTDRENQYAYEMLPKLPEINETIVAEPVDNLWDFDRILDRNYRQSNIVEIVRTFKRLNRFACDHNLDLSNHCYDNLVDGLIDNCEYLTDQLLYELLAIIGKYPQCDTIQSHNYYDIWCCLDDICCWKLSKWPIEQMFRYVLLWYDLNLGRLCDFTYEVIDRSLRRIRHLTRDDLLHLFFCYNICRRQNVSFDIEDKLSRIVGEYDVDELAIIAMGYFKTQSKIKLEAILKEMIRKVYENTAIINEITLAAILKVIRLSQYLPLTTDLDLMLDRLSPEIDRLSDMTCLHIALIGSSIQYKHDTTLQLTSSKLLSNLPNIRLKDIERILLANVMFDSDPCDGFYEAIVDELNRPNRQSEILQYNRCLPMILHYLSYRNIYIYPLLDSILDDDYITELYGKSSKSTPLPLFSLNQSIGIECPDYRGNRLQPYRQYKIVKWLTEYPPSFDQKRRATHADRLFLDCCKTLEMLLGYRPDLLHIDHILPHFSKADIVLCKNRQNGEFIEPYGFQNYVLGDTKFPFNLDEHEWYAVVVLVPNLTVRHTSNPLGTVRMKLRQLKRIGYNPIVVPWLEFPSMTVDERLEFFKRHLSL